MQDNRGSSSLPFDLSEDAPIEFDDLIDSESLQSTRGSLSFNTKWEIDLWGKLRQGRLAGKRQYLSSKYNYTYIQFSLTAEATKLYFSIIESKQLVENAKQKYNNAKNYTFAK